MGELGAVLAAVLPSIGVGLVFWFVVRALVQADRRERLALARLDAEDRARREAERRTVLDEGRPQDEPRTGDDDVAEGPRAQE
ncbi:hypothetical protein SAMN05421867_10386 [Cellulomonas marina]|uniref:Uncharacterized protein n=1 Tax=Cellulomonas marina TaxID=988821 RepID=A0A1I0WLE8_9CELL|nr:hypothetical protein [Cellulomonas marina]SFA89615.1 hypothetical protein SAMN05421867_10386 [Cellulomonas marina]